MSDKPTIGSVRWENRDAGWPYDWRGTDGHFWFRAYSWEDTNGNQLYEIALTDDDGERLAVGSWGHSWDEAWHSLAPEVTQRAKDLLWWVSATFCQSTSDKMSKSP